MKMKFSAVLACLIAMLGSGIAMAAPSEAATTTRQVAVTKPQPVRPITSVDAIADPVVETGLPTGETSTGTVTAMVAYSEHGSW